MEQQLDGTDVNLEGLLALVEKAVSAIERLQSENAMLAAQARDYEVAIKSAQLEAGLRAERIEVLERAENTLKEDADWCRWFRNRYGGSTFFLHIQREYLNRHDKNTGSIGCIDAPLHPIAMPSGATHSA